jgi:hypothetical protein
MIETLIRPLLIVWGAVTVAFVVVMAWKSFAGVRETDVVILGEENRQAEEQKAMMTKMQTLVAWAKGLGVASLALILLVGGLSIYSNLMSS